MGESQGRVRPVFIMLMLASVACNPPTLAEPPTPSAPDSGAMDAGADATFPDTGVGRTELALTRVAPNHGSFLGGNEVIVRGGGFTESTTVSFGGRLVQAADTQWIDANRLLVQAVPAGEPGPADVVVTQGAQAATLTDGYTFDAVSLDPTRGSIGGGTLVTITASGTSFGEGDTVLLGRAACRDVEIVSPTVLRCITSASAVGSVDLVYTQSAEGRRIEVPDAFEYYDSSDPSSGGLGGGPLMGNLNVAVFNGLTGEPVADAFVIVGEDRMTDHQGLTGLLGQIGFSGDDLIGQHTVHVAKDCFEKTSFVSFDAQDVTVFLIPWMDPRCGMGGGGGGGAGRLGAFVSGELIWSATAEFDVPSPNPWDNVPQPRSESWRRTAFVYTTQRCAGTSPSCSNPDPAQTGTQPQVLEVEGGRRGYPYRIFVRPSAFAVYALAGVENTRTGEFVPYVMGIARNVLAGPGQDVQNIDMIMNIPLDHYLDVSVDELPDATPTGPNRFEVSADIDLGGEGVIVRRLLEGPMDILTSRTSDQTFRFFAQPALFGALSDGRYRIQADWETGDFGADPSAHSVLTGVREVDTTVSVDGFTAIPVATAPGFGESFPDDRILRWDAAGGEQPDFYWIQMIDGDGNSAWRMFIRGDQLSAPIPDLSEVPGIDDVAPGFVTWFMYAIRIPSFQYDEMTYRDLARSRWNAWSINTFTARQ